MQNPINTAISFALLISVVGASFAYASTNPVEIPKQPWIGVEATNITAAIAEQIGLEQRYGVLIVIVEPGSPADNAGLRGANRVVEIEGESIGLGGDVIVGIDGNEVRVRDDIARALDQKQIGDNVEFTVVREGRELDVNVILGERRV